MEIKIKKLSEIDFENIDPNNDVFILPNNEKYKVSDNVCHICWSGGTVLENKTNGDLCCLQCDLNLKWQKVKFKLEEDEQEIEDSFLLPESFSKDELEEWKEEFIKIREKQNTMRDNILNTNEGGNYL